MEENQIQHDTFSPTLRYYNPFDFMPNESQDMIPQNFPKENEIEVHEEVPDEEI